ncbi:protein-histidine kinase [Gigaspora margarita]|uniref:histidine kinase n=1 Tax=Gigaspora margarita TaxID=4874 RepID=A0A8H3X349_GIGMA|nr:protein-histidine kinase [Gigaspora margarita]
MSMRDSSVNRSSKSFTASSMQSFCSMSLSPTYNGDYIENEDSNIADLVNNYDWSATSLGPMDTWKPALKNAVNVCLHTPFPICLYLGPEWILIYNQKYRPILKTKHPDAIGKPAKKVWHEIYSYFQERFESVKATGKGMFKNDELLELFRDGYAEEAYFNYTLSPIFESDGTFLGIFNPAQETTQKVLNARRLKILGESGSQISKVNSLESACSIMKNILNDNHTDIPYALIYFIEHKLNHDGSESSIARLITTTFDEDGKKERHFPDYFPETHEIINLTNYVDQSYDKYINLRRASTSYSFLKCDSWPLNLVIKNGNHIKVILKNDSQAVLFLTKISLGGEKVLPVVLICGVNRRRALDDQYLEFLQLVTNQLNTYLLHGKKIEEEKLRSKLLADLNYQKVMFFQGISHELQILLVDDSNEMRDHLTDLLKEFDIYRACDGKDALRVLKTLKQLPDLVLSDVTMPNMNGYELLDVLRSNVNTQLIPIILLSAKAGEDSKVKGLDKGADDYLVKPFSARELITRIRANIELSVLRRKILFHRCQEEESKQLLMSIANMIFSGLSINETLQYVVKEIHHRIPCERVLVISNEQSKSKANEIIVSYEDSESVTLIANPFMEINDNNNDKRKSQSSINSQEYLNDNSGIDISLNVYCDYVHKNVSILSSEVKLNNDFWGWIKIYRSPNSIWLDSEIELLQQISNLMSLAITHANLLEENEEKEIQIKAAEVADKTKSQILANTSHELRTPLGAIVGILSSFECNSLTTDQRDMIDTMLRSSDIVLSIINDILDSARLEAQKVTLINKTFDLLVLLDDIIEKFGKKAGSKKIELIVNCEVDELPRYVKSDPDRLKQVLSHLLSNSIKFTEQGEIVLTISMQSKKAIDENKVIPTSDTASNPNSDLSGLKVEKGCLLIELHDTGIGMNPEYIQHAWKSFSQGDMSITKKNDGRGLGLSICKSLVEINGGEIKAESQLGKGSKFWFTWNVEILSTTPTISNFISISTLEAQLYKQMKYSLYQVIIQKRILIIHPVESVRHSLLKYLQKIEKVDAFDTFDKGIRTIKEYKELYDRFAYDIAFISLYEHNKEEVMKASLELRKLEPNNNNLIIIFIVFSDNEGNELNELVENLIEKIGGTIDIIYTPITWKKLANLFVNMEKNNETGCLYVGERVHQKQIPDIICKDVPQEIRRDIILRYSENRIRNVNKSKCILCVVCFAFSIFWFDHVYLLFFLFFYFFYRRIYFGAQ